MAELLPTERLQPSLLDRLADDDRDHQQESRDKRVLSQKRLRESVLRDLAWLLNSVAMDAGQKLDKYEEVMHSVVNFGIPDLAGHPLSGTDLVAVERKIRQAIWDFEPRIMRSSLKIKVIASREQYNHNALAFEIEGDLWMQPLPLRLYLQTEIDLETGHVELIDQAV